MLTESYINDSMRQYEKWAENEIMKNKPKHPKAHGIKQPETMKLVAAVAGIFAIVVIIAQFSV